MHEGNLRSWGIWLTAGGFYLFEFVHRVALSVMLPELSQSFNVSSALLSGLAASYFFAYAFAQIPVGLLIDRFGTRRLLSLACFIISIASFIFAYTDNIFIATYCRILIGFGSAFAFVGCLKLAANWFPAHRFAFIVGLTNLFGVCGALIGGNPIAHAVDAFGWRDIMFSSGIIGLTITLLLWRIVRDGSKDKKTALIRFKLLSVIKSRQTWLIAIFAGCMVAPVVSYSELWGVTYLMNTYNISRPAAAHITTLTFVGIAIGGPFIGWLSDYFRQRTIFMAIGLAGAMITMSLILFGPIMPFWLIGLLHIGFGFFTSSMLLCFSLNSEATSASIRATTIAFTNSIIMLSGALLQTLTGYVLDITQNNFNLSFMPIIFSYILALICFKFIRSTACTFCDD